MPWDIWFQRNQVWNRLFLETLGYYIPAVGLSRNRYEQVEKGADWLCWVIIGLGLPILLGALFKKGFNNKFIVPWVKKLGFDLKGQHPLSMPFEWLDQASLKNASIQNQLRQALKLPSIKTEQLAELAKKIALGKVLLMLTDLFFMASKGQIYFWGKNWMTEKLSGKKGFSGELSLASDAYLKHKSAAHEKSKKQKLWLSLGLGYGGAALLPLFTWLLMTRSKTPIPKSFWGSSGAMSKIKALIPKLNYTDIIYMSKWVIQWHFIFNWELPGLLSGRDSHERREHIIRATVFNFFYFFGDALIAGVAAKYLPRWLKSFKNPEVQRQVVKPIQIWRLKLPGAKMVHEVWRSVGENAKHPALRLARWSSWLGLVGTAMGMGVTMTLVNNWITKQKVLKEQAQLFSKLRSEKALWTPPSMGRQAIPHRL